MGLKTVFITGASSGIGKACANEFAKNNYRLILLARREERLQELKKELVEKYNIEVHLLSFDIRNKENCFSAIENLPKEWQQIDILINNAGLALGTNPFDSAEIDDWENMIDTNVKSLLYISRATLPLLLSQENPHIINIGSIAGKEVYPGGNVYCATKHAVDAITKAMRIDLLEKGVKVSSVSPGAVETEFSIVRFKGDEEKAKKVYNNYEPLVAQDIAEAVYFAASRPAHVNINDILIMPKAQANATIFNKK